MLMLRVVLGAALGYAVVVLLATLLQERLAFPAPRAPVPDPRRLGIAYGERVELVLGDGTKLVGWYLSPTTRNDGGGRGKAGKVGNTSPDLPRPSPSFPALLWFYGNGENIAGIAPVLRDFQPPGTALLVVDYPGYGGSGGRATEAALYAAAAPADRAPPSRPRCHPPRLAGLGPPP